MRVRWLRKALRNLDDEASFIAADSPEAAQLVVRCRALNIEHRLCPPRHPQTNGMVERFNARISEVVNQTRFASAADLEATLHQYVKTYNHLIPQRALKHISPVQALKDWHAKKPELFKKRVYNQPGLDT